MPGQWEKTDGQLVKTSEPVGFLYGKEHAPSLFYHNICIKQVETVKAGKKRRM
ncbi:hypothetical protein [Thermicanus aegyptius]|uniref:hypothetical protein n=1 Tax=Thermicanus aegyptius TaxID=94009 RepID=UPI00034B8E9C|nr:hypothetical protein [Thermicanus aegyptius]